MKDLIERAADDLSKSEYAIALSGAGMSTESGIPDFRGPNGLWTKDPQAERQAYEAYELFQESPRQFWEERLNPESAMRRMLDKFGELEKAVPNPGHQALAELERMGILKYILTQNVDGLHTRAGNKNVAEYHGSINKFRCIRCGKRLAQDELDLEKLGAEGPLPPRCECGGIIKDDGVFFGEPIPEDVRILSEEEALKCDVMLICGTSAVVQPFAGLPRLARFGSDDFPFGTSSSSSDRRRATIIEVNAEPTPLTDLISDYLIQGKTGVILPQIVEAVKRITS
ncbi:MAG: NAD-dependent deacylase [Dehalococcoidia bacterium]